MVSALGSALVPYGKPANILHPRTSRLDTMPRLRLFALILFLATPLTAQTNRARPRPGVDLAGMDTTVQPGNDFWQYANGTWLKQTEIPADRSSWGPSGVLTELTDRRTGDLIKEVAGSGAPAGSDRRKIGDYYAAFLDTVAIDRRGLVPLKPTLDSIAALEDQKGAEPLSRQHAPGRRGHLQRHQPLHPEPAGPLGRAGPGRSIALLRVPGAGRVGDARPELLPRLLRRDRAGPRPVPAARGSHAQLAGVPEPEAKAAAIVQLETRIAQAHLSREASEDVRKGNNHWSRETSRPRRRASTGRPTSRRPGLAKVNRFVVWHRARSPGSRRWWRASRSKPGRTGSRTTPSRPVRRCCRAVRE